MFTLFIFALFNLIPVTAAILLTLYILSYFNRFQSLKRYRFDLSVIPTSWILTYCLAYIGFLLEPNLTWEDNGVIEKIYPEELWSWALVYTYFLQFIFVPLFVGVMYSIKLSITFLYNKKMN